MARDVADTVVLGFGGWSDISALPTLGFGTGVAAPTGGGADAPRRVPRFQWPPYRDPVETLRRAPTTFRHRSRVVVESPNLRVHSRFVRVEHMANLPCPPQPRVHRESVRVRGGDFAVRAEVRFGNPRLDERHRIEDELLVRAELLDLDFADLLVAAEPLLRRYLELRVPKFPKG